MTNEATAAPMDATIMPRSGWINPSGQVFGVDWAEHDRFAMRVLRRSLVRRYEVAAAERLRALGWVSYCHLRGFFAERELNNAQVTAVFDICEQYRYDLPVTLPGWQTK